MCRFGTASIFTDFLKLVCMGDIPSHNRTRTELARPQLASHLHTKAVV
jgi:hypothetical protein